MTDFKYIKQKDLIEQLNNLINTPDGLDRGIKLLEFILLNKLVKVEVFPEVL